ncbi:hypothetical protein RRG08_028364 [Elysia crispata]|uniref:Major facilitator superfamily (MFS) profile domain-containing protein n=1 Tax=Elysia crispata TaxID=231223 RepID=A0AAE1E6B8_9GAST|nr:hypothetical protein RRG08_028364 [Elysia crispata]
MPQNGSSERVVAVSTKSVDDVLLALNWWGRYQKVQFVMLMLPVLACVMHSMSVVFIGRDAEHRCAAPGSTNHWRGSTNINSTIIISRIYDNNTDLGYSVDPSFTNGTVTKYGKCRIRTFDSSGRQISSAKCPQGYQYSEPRDRTFVSEWNLVCEQETLSDFSQMVMAIGMTLGAVVFSFLSDRFGRKVIYMFCHTILFLVAVATAFTPNFVVFTILRFFTGATQQGTALTTSVLNIEQLPTAHRALPAVLGLVAYLTRDINWRYAQLLMSAFSVYVLIQWWITDESLRWLVANGRTRQAEKNIRKAARQNGTDVSRVLKVFRQETQPVLLPQTNKSETGFGKTGLSDSEQNEASEKPCPSEQEKPISFLQAIRHKTVLKVLVICCCIWFADSVSYYGLIMTSTSLVDDLYLGYTVNILVELPAALAYVMLINRIGRLKCIYIFNTIGGLSLLTAVCLSTIPGAESIPGRSILIVIVSLLGKFGVSLAYGTLWVFTPELFPTNIRNTCLGVSSMAARAGGMVAPYSRTLGRHFPWAPGVIFGVLCLMIPLLTLFLPETHGREGPGCHLRSVVSDDSLTDTVSARDTRS